ncbi:MAG: WD40 repeat domain-containing protein, partial [Gemmataceae bacterium]
MTRCWTVAVLLTAVATGHAADTDRYGVPLPAGAVARCGCAQLRVDAVNGRVFTLSPDGRFLTLDSPHGAWLWDATTGKLRYFRTGTQPAHTRLSRDGRTLITDLKTHLIVWDVATGEQRRHIPTEGKLPAEPAHLALSPDGRRIAALDEDGAVGVWETDTGREVMREKAHEGWTAGVAFTADGGRVVTLSRRGEIRSWDLAARKLAGKHQIDVNVYDNLQL